MSIVPWSEQSHLQEIDRCQRELGQAELVAARAREGLCKAMVAAHRFGVKTGLICEAAGVSRQWLHQLLAKEKKA